MIPLKETHYSDISNKESILKKEPTKKDSKPKEIKTKIKRSDSGKSELKVNISVGSKVLIVEPLGVYDCINLGRRIDVQWPSEYQRERGGRNYWGSWVPLAGMDGLVSTRTFLLPFIISILFYVPNCSACASLE